MNDAVSSTGTPTEDGSLGLGKERWAGPGAVVAAFLASLCCVGPVVFAAFGFSAGLVSIFEPLRPLFTVAMAGLLAVGFYTVYGRPRTVNADGEACAARPARRHKILLWVAAGLTLAVWSFPYWSVLLI